MNATVTLPITDWEEMKKKNERAVDRIAQLERELAEAKECGADPIVQILTKGFLGAYELVRFCIAHAHPEVVKAQPWPFEALLLFADALEHVPLVTPHAAVRQEAAIDMRHMAKEAAEWNLKRAERKLALERGEVPAIGETLSPTPTID